MAAADTKKFKSPSKFAHIVLRTKPERFQEMTDWYLTVLGGDLVHNDGLISFISYDDEHHRIAIAAIPGLVDLPENAVGVDHFAYTYDSLEDLLAQYERLKGEGIEPFWCINHGPTISMYFHDPTGNRIELQIDVFETTAEAMEWMKRSDFDKNPVGITYDPDELLVRLRAGETYEDLTKRRPLDEGESFFDHLR